MAKAKLSKKDLGNAKGLKKALKHIGACSEGIKGALKSGKTGKTAYNKANVHDLNFIIETVSGLLCRTDVPSKAQRNAANKMYDFSDDLIMKVMNEEDEIAGGLEMSVFDEGFFKVPKVVAMHAKYADKLRKKVPYEAVADLFDTYVAVSLAEESQWFGEGK